MVEFDNYKTYAKLKDSLKHCRDIAILIRIEARRGFVDDGKRFCIFSPVGSISCALRYFESWLL
jgi:hypothetical protein